MISSMTLSNPHASILSSSFGMRERSGKPFVFTSSAGRFSSRSFFMVSFIFSSFLKETIPVNPLYVFPLYLKNSAIFLFGYFIRQSRPPSKRKNLLWQRRGALPMQILSFFFDGSGIAQWEFGEVFGRRDLWLLGFVLVFTE